MSSFLGILFSVAVLWGCWQFFKRLRPVRVPNMDEPWSMKRSEPVQSPESLSKLPAHLLEGCPPDPCPEVLYERLTPVPALTYAELKRPKDRFVEDCCGGPRTYTLGYLFCPECDHLDIPEE